MAEFLNTTHDQKDEARRLFERMWSALDQIRHDEEIYMRLSVELADEVDDVLARASSLRF